MIRWHHPLVIINPRAGLHGSERAAPKLLARFFEHHHIAMEVREIAGSTDARTWAGHAKSEGFDLLLVVGGDGTVNQVVSGFGKTNALPIAILPTGTTNLLAQNIGLPKKIERCIDLLAEGVVRRFDVGRSPTHDRGMINAVTVGYGTKIFEDARQELKNLLGYRAYVFAALKNLIRIPSAEFHCTIDGQRHDVEAQMVIVANTNIPSLRTAGVGPETRVDDGKFEVLIFSHKSFLALADLVAGLMLHRKPQKPVIRTYLGRSVLIETNPVLPVAIDGDPVEGTPVRVEMDEGGLAILAPKMKKGARATQKNIR